MNQEKAPKHTFLQNAPMSVYKNTTLQPVATAAPSKQFLELSLRTLSSVTVGARR